MRGVLIGALLFLVGTVSVVTAGDLIPGSFPDVQTPRVGVVRAWRDGFMAGYELALERITDALRRHTELLDAIATWKQLLVAGEVPPVVLKVKFDVQRNEDGTYSIVRRVVFAPVKPEDLRDAAVLKSLFENKLAEVGSASLKGTYWAYKDVRREPLKSIATYQFIARRAGYTPFIRDEKLVFGVFDRLADAQYVAERLKKLGVPDVKAGPAGGGEALLVKKEFAEREQASFKTPSGLVRTTKPKKTEEKPDAGVMELLDGETEFGD